MRLAEETEETFGQIDVLVSNAGVGRVQPLEGITISDFDDAFAVNLRAPFLLAQRLLPAMERRGFGRVLFMSSVAAFTGGRVGPHYAAAKAGLHGLTHSLAARFARAASRSTRSLRRLSRTPACCQATRPTCACTCLSAGSGWPAEVADLALAVLRNPYLSSQVISLDGGMYPH